MEKKKVSKKAKVIIISVLGVIFALIVVGVYAFKNIPSNGVYYDSYSEEFVDESTGGSISGIDPAGNGLFDSDSPALLSRSSGSAKTVSRSVSDSASSSPTVTSEPPATKEKNIMKEGSIRFRADDMDKALSSLKDVISKYNGEITNSYDGGTGKERSASLTVKVPQDKYEELFEKLENLDIEKLHSKSNATDVTEQVIDLRARLVTDRNTEAQLLEIQKTAKTVADTITVYRELTSIRQNIERTESQLKYYASRTNYSTISISISQSSVGASIEDQKWRPKGIFMDALRAFVNVAKFFGSLFIWLAVFGIPVAIIVYIVRYIVRKIKASKQEN